MAAHEKISERQFKANVLTPEGERDQVFNSATHLIGLMSVENVREGDLWRMLHQHQFPYQQATGASIHDREHPTPDAITIPMRRETSQHMPRGTKLKVIRQRKSAG